MITFKNKSPDSLNADLNIMPILDILSTLVVFLLLTAVWYQVGSYQTESQLGSTATQNQKPKTLIIATLKDNKTLQLKIDRPHQKTLLIDLKQTDLAKGQIIAAIQQLLQGQNQPIEEFESVVIPESTTSYKTVIFVMDQISKSGLKSINLGYQKGS